MKKLPPDEIKTIAAKIKADYAYMDKLGSTGWLWELIRRSYVYRNTCDELRQFIKIQRRMSAQQIRGYVDRLFLENDIEIVRYDKLPKVDNIHDSYIVARSDSREVYLVPRYERRFIDFKDELLFKIVGSDFFKINYEVPNLFDLHPSTRGSLCSNIILDLAILNSDNTVYVGISKAAKYNDLKNILLPELRRTLSGFGNKQKRIRHDKWKYYLVCYDLRARDNNMTYDTIANIMINAYEEIIVNKTIDNKRVKIKEPSYSLFNPRTMENYFNTAFDLINGKYKKYLYEGRKSIFP
jgi:hypothetical protein